MTHPILIMLSGLAIIFITAVWNAYVVLWGTTSLPVWRDLFSRIWHKDGLILRAMIGIVLGLVMWINHFSVLSWVFWGLTFLNFSWTIYDLTINYIRNYYHDKMNRLIIGIWHIDNKGINAWFIDHLSELGIWIFRAALILTNIILLFYVI